MAYNNTTVWIAVMSLLVSARSKLWSFTLLINTSKKHRKKIASFTKFVIAFCHCSCLGTRQDYLWVFKSTFFVNMNCIMFTTFLCLCSPLNFCLSDNFFSDFCQICLLYTGYITSRNYIYSLMHQRLVVPLIYWRHCLPHSLNLFINVKVFRWRIHCGREPCRKSVCLTNVRYKPILTKSHKL